MKLSEQPSYVWAAIAALMVMVLAMRWSFLILPRRFQPKGALAEALSYAPIAALVAICVPEVLQFQMDRWPMANWPSITWPVFFSHLMSDWRLWGGLAMITVAGLTRTSKSASLYGLVAAALVVWAM